MKRRDLKPGTVFGYLFEGADNHAAIHWCVDDHHPEMPPKYANPLAGLKYAMRSVTSALATTDGDTDVVVYWEPPPSALTDPPHTSILTTDKKARKEMPIARGVVDYFPRALAAVANVSFVANEQHNPGEPMHWDKSKSTDHADCIARHLIERGSVDDDGLRHSAKLAWRALALLETELSK
jgi:hypothetical protein